MKFISLNSCLLFPSLGIATFFIAFLLLYFYLRPRLKARKEDKAPLILRPSGTYQRDQDHDVLEKIFLMSTEETSFHAVTALRSLMMIQPVFEAQGCIPPQLTHIDCHSDKLLLPEPELEPEPEIQPLREIVVDYTPDNVRVAYTESLEITIVFDAQRSGSRWRTIMKNGFGLYKARIRTPLGNASGLCTSFYLSTLEGDKQQDEIDFEFLGKDDGLAVQTNVHMGGTGNREAVHQLGFRTSEAFHEYAISWSSTSITWSIDGTCIRAIEKGARGSEPAAWPVRPMYLYASLWNAENVADGKWAGPYVGCDEPYACAYKDVFVPAGCSTHPH